MSFTEFTLVLLVILLTAVLVGGLALSEMRLGAPRREKRERIGFFALGLVIWLAIIAVAGAGGYMSDVNSMPPPAARVAVPTLVMVIYLAFSRFGSRLVRGLRYEELIGLQSFRLPVEIILLGFYFEGKIPVTMTMEGRNFDVLTAVTAILIAFLLYTGTLNRKFIWAWNFLGLTLLLNVLITAVLSVPGRLRILQDEPPNILPLHWPTNWILFCAFVALFSHLLVFRKLVAEK
jgi:hypothetical protein